MMRKFYILLIASMVFMTCSVFAQQIGNYSHEFYKPAIINPAFAGNQDGISAMLISRSQWIDFKNSPQQNIFMLDGMIPDKKMAIGIDLFSDRKGISHKVGGNIFYSYKLKINDNSKLSLGIALGVIDHSLNYSEAVIENTNDPTLTGPVQRMTAINGNAGICFTWKNLDIGISIPQLFGDAFQIEDNVYGKASYAFSRHYAATLKYSFTLSKEKQIEIVPMGIIHYHPDAPLQYDGNLNLIMKDKFWIGATYKSDHALAANAGVCISKKIYIGYSYDFIIGSIGPYSGMSHELMLNFIFGKKKAKEEIDVAQISRNKELADSLSTELEMKNNEVQNKEKKVQELNSKVAQLQKDNKDLRDAQAAKQSNNTVPEVSSDNSKNKTPNTTQTQNTSANTIVPAEKSNNVSATNSSDNRNTNETINTGGENQKIKDGTVFRAADSNEYFYLNDKPASKGYYVVIGTFFYRDFAENELTRIRSLGYSSARILYSSSKKYNYVSAFYSLTEDDAIKMVNKLKANGTSDVWVLSVEP